MSVDNTPTAGLIVIGNEVLSGRTRDRNIQFLGARLNAMGIGLGEARIIPDREDVIVAAVNECRAKYDYVFTTGGIGPTHDDITAACIAKAFGRDLVRDGDAVRMLRLHYTADEINEARLGMADVPEGARLIENPVSRAPGFQVENVFVMAGVPMIVEAMFDSLAPRLKGGPPVSSRTVSGFTSEGGMAEDLGELQARHPEVEIGSYPFVRSGRLGVSLVARSTDESKLDAVAEDLRALIRARGVEAIDGMRPEN